jgi:hypothetical protein
MNLHAPERQNGESFDAYKLRRAASKAHNATLTCKGMSGGKTSRETRRDSARMNGKLRASYGAGLIAAGNTTRRDAIHKQNGHSKAAWTFVGREVNSVLAWDEDGRPITGGRLMPAGCGSLRRVWLAGISAQRGY